MRTHFPRIIIAVGLVLQLSCTNTHLTTNRIEAAQTPLANALYAAQLNGYTDDIIQVAIKHAEAGNFNKAIAIVESIEERGFLEYLRDGFNFRRVLAYNVASKIEALGKIALLQAKAGNAELGLKGLERSYTLANLVEDDKDGTRTVQLTNVATKFILIGKPERAFSILNTLPLTTTKLDDADVRRQYLRIQIEVAAALAKTGDSQKSLQTLEQAENIFTSIPPGNVTGSEGLDIVNVYIQLGRVEKAYNLIQTFIEKEKAEDEHDWNYSVFAEKLTELGKLADGIKLADSIKRLNVQASTYAKMAKQLAKSKDYKSAFSLLKKIPSEESQSLSEAQEQIAKLFLDERNFSKAFEIVEQIDHANNKALVLSYAAQKYSSLDNQSKARETAITAFEIAKEKPADDGFIDSAVQYILLVDKNIGMEKLKEEGVKRGSGTMLEEIAKKLVEANQDILAIEVLKYIQAEDYVDDAGPITIRDYRTRAIVKMAFHYYDSKRPIDTELISILAEFVKLLD